MAKYLGSSGFWGLGAGEMTSDAIDWLVEKSQTPEGRQEIYNLIGEMGGGTLGALAGSGWLSIPASGLTAASAKRMMEAIGPYIGGSGATDRTMGEEATSFATDAALNTLGEGGGRLLSKAMKPGAWRNLARRPFTPRDQVGGTSRAALNAIADEADIPMTLAARSGRRTPRFIETALGVMPTSIDVIHGAAKESIDAINEKGFGQVARGIYKDPVSTSQIADEAVDVLAGKQEGVRSAMDALVGRPPSRAAAGQAYREARDATIDELSKLGKQLYDENPLLQPHWDSLIDMTDAGERARQILEASYSPDELSAILPTKARRDLIALSSLRPKEVIQGPGGVSAEEFARNLGGSIDEVPPHLWQRFGFESGSEAPAITLRQLKELRTALMEAQRKLTAYSPASDRRGLANAVDIMNEAVEKSGLPPEVKQEWGRVGQVYRAKHQDLFNSPGSSKGKSKPGNKSAELAAGKEPEDVIDAIVQPGSQVGDRTIPDALKAAGDKPELDTFAEGVVGYKYADPAKRKMPMGPGEYVSPEGVASARKKMGPGVEEALFTNRGKSLPGLLEEGTSPDMLAREAEAFTDKRARGIMGFADHNVGAEQLLRNNMAPMRNPDRFQESVAFMGPEGGQRLRRAFMDDAFGQATKRDPNIGMDAVMSPTALENLYRKNRGAFDVALGDDAALKQKFDDMTKLGLMAKESETMYANTSRTTPALMAVNTMKQLMQGLAAAGAGGLAGLDPLASGVAGAAVPWLAAKQYADQGMAKFLTSAPERVAGGGPLSGLGGRVAVGIMTQDKPEEKPKNPLDDILGY